MTGQELINSSLRLLGVLGQGESPSASESSDALVALNHLIRAWSAQQLPIFQVSRQTIPLTGVEQYNIPIRPMRIKSAAILNGGVTMPLRMATAELWADGSQSMLVLPDGLFPTGTVRIRPAATSGTLELWTLNPLATIAGLGTTISLPDGYEPALSYNLALALAPEYGRPAPAEMVALAAEFKNGITILNQQVLGLPPAAAA